MNPLLHQAARYGDIEAVKNLIANGVDLNLQEEEGWTALRVSINHGNTFIAKRLMDAGADVNIQDTKGWTALMRASLRGYTALAADLLAAGANAHLKNEGGNTALDLAKRYGDAEIVKLIEDHINSVKLAKATNEQLIDELNRRLKK